MPSTVKPTARKNEIVVQEVENELLVYDLRINKAICLNQTSASVWNKCDGRTSVEEIKDSLGRDTQSEVPGEVVWFALDQLEKEKLLEGFDKAVSPLRGLSRRDILKRIGLTTAVALPFVSSLIAPQAVHAQSLNLLCDVPRGQIPSGCPCTSNGDCNHGQCVMNLCE